MKKLITLTFMFSIIFLASCSKQENIEKITNSSSGKVLIQTGAENITSKGIELKSQTGTENNTQTGIIEDKKTEIKKPKSLAIENFNVVLKEDGKTINKLTTKATGQKECDWDAGDEGTKTIYNYNIIVANGKYGIVKRETQICGISSLGKTYFGIDLENNSELQELYNTNFEVKEKIEGDNLKITILYPENVIDNEADMWQGSILLPNLKKEGFSKVGNDWIKTINLKDKIKPETKKEENKETIKNNEKPKVETIKLDAKYSNENLIKNGYKLNNLGDIKEYYKEELIPEKLDTDGMLINRGYSSWKTIYIEGNNVLDFEINSDGGQKLIINNPETRDIIDLGEFGYPIQAIFGGNLPKIIISDLNNIKIKKEDGTSQILWTRK